MTRRGLVPKTDAFFFLRFGFVSQTVSVAAASEILAATTSRYSWSGPEAATIPYMEQPRSSSWGACAARSGAEAFVTT